MIDHALHLEEEAYALENSAKWKQAESRWREALSIFESEEGSRHPDTANLLRVLANNLMHQCRYLEAEKLARQAVEIMDEVVHLVDGPEGKVVQVEALLVHGNVLRELARYADAEAVLKRALALSEPDLLDSTGGALNSLGIVYKYWGKFEEGERVYRRALEIFKQLYGEQSAAVATLYHNLGGLEHQRGRFELAEEPARRAWEIRRELLGELHPDVLADACAYGGVLDGLGRTHESRPIYETALKEYERIFGPEHFEVAATLHNLAWVENAEGNRDAAEQNYRRALAIKRKLLGPEHPECALTAANLEALAAPPACAN